MLRVVFLVLLVVNCAPPVLSQIGDNPMVMLSEFKLRERVKSAVDPVFPEKALADGAKGLVIVAVHFDDEGNFHNARVLKSPHPEISAAVTKALENWKINPYVIDKVLKSRVQTEIRFLFEIDFETRRGDRAGVPGRASQLERPVAVQ